MNKTKKKIKLKFSNSSKCLLSVSEQVTIMKYIFIYIKNHCQNVVVFLIVGFNNEGRVDEN